MKSFYRVTSILCILLTIGVLISGIAAGYWVVEEAPAVEEEEGEVAEEAAPMMIVSATSFGKVQSEHPAPNAPARAGINGHGQGHGYGIGHGTRNSHTETGGNIGGSLSIGKAAPGNPADVTISANDTTKDVITVTSRSNSKIKEG